MKRVREWILLGTLVIVLVTLVMVVLASAAATAEASTVTGKIGEDSSDVKPTGFKFAIACLTGKDEGFELQSRRPGSLVLVLERLGVVEFACEGGRYCPCELEEPCPKGCWWDPDREWEDSVRGPQKGICLKQGPCYWSSDLGMCVDGSGLCGQWGGTPCQLVVTCSQFPEEFPDETCEGVCAGGCRKVEGSTWHPCVWSSAHGSCAQTCPRGFGFPFEWVECTLKE